MLWFLPSSMCLGGSTVTQITVWESGVIMRWALPPSLPGWTFTLQRQVCETLDKVMMLCMWFLSISQININGFLAWTALLWMKLQAFAFAFILFGQTLLPKAAYIVFKVNIWSALAFPGNRTHDLGIASSMLYCLSFRMVRI